MKKARDLFLAFFMIILLIIACKEAPVPVSSNEETEAKDYMPYTDNGYIYRWQKSNVIDIYLPIGAVAGYDATDRTAFIDGVNRWEPLLTSLGITLNFKLSNPSDIEVIWDDGSGAPTGVVGYARIDSSQNPSRRILMTTQSNIDWTEHSAATIEEVATHEFGHMLGIWSHSFDSSDRMWPYVQGTNGLSGRDLGTMSHVYSLTADVNLSSWGQNTISLPILPADIPPFSIQCSFGFESLKEVDGFEPIVFE